MAFSRAGFRGIGGYNRGFEGGQRYSYVFTDDTLATIKAASYFDSIANALGTNDLIDLVGSDGAQTVKVLTANETDTVTVIPIGGTGLFTAGAATLTLVQATHSGSTIINDQTGGLAITMPASTGDGATYRIVNSAASGTANTITCAGADVFVGHILLASSVVLSNLFISDGTDTIITQNLTTSGLGDPGDFAFIQDITAGSFVVTGMMQSSGTPVTPFG